MTRIHTDGIRLKQVLLNLIGNSIKFTDTGGVHIALENKKVIIEGQELANPVVYFRIKDTGCGIPEENIGDLF